MLLKIQVFLFLASVWLCSCSGVFCQQLNTNHYKSWNASDTLLWSDYTLTDLDQTLKYGLRAKAVTSYAYFYLPQIWHADSCMNVLTTFRRRHSYTADTTSVSLLAHESIHFDIAELFARYLRKELLDLSQKEDYNLDQYLTLRDSLFNAASNYQALYDDETVYGLNRKEQQKWRDHIKSELEKWKDYSFENIYLLCNPSLANRKAQ
jgi:hypothetical protein